MDATEVRRINLIALIKKQGAQNKFADLVETPAPFLSQVVNQKRGMGTTVARRIEAKLGKPRGWMDNLQTPAEMGTNDTNRKPLLKALVNIVNAFFQGTALLDPENRSKKMSFIIAIYENLDLSKSQSKDISMTSIVMDAVEKALEKPDVKIDLDEGDLTELIYFVQKEFEQHLKLERRIA